MIEFLFETMNSNGMFWIFSYNIELVYEILSYSCRYRNVQMKWRQYKNRAIANLVQSTEYGFVPLSGRVEYSLIL